MSASKDIKRGTWKIYLRYIDWQGNTQIHTKRGFKTKREALEYERGFLSSKSKDMNMLFNSFVEIYYADMETRLREHTMPKGKYYIQSLLHQQINIVVGKYQSERLSLEIRRLSAQIEKMDLNIDNDGISVLVDCKALLTQILELTERSGDVDMATAYDFRIKK